jgi:hypothetical protein
MSNPMPWPVRWTNPPKILRLQMPRAARSTSHARCPAHGVHRQPLRLLHPLVRAADLVRWLAAADRPADVRAVPADSATEVEDDDIAAPHTSLAGAVVGKCRVRTGGNQRLECRLLRPGVDHGALERAGKLEFRAALKAGLEDPGKCLVGAPARSFEQRDLVNVLSHPHLRQHRPPTQTAVRRL